MKDDPIELIQIVSIINVMYIILTRIVVIFLIDAVKGEIPFFNISIGSISIDIFPILIFYCGLNLVSALITVVMIHIPFKTGKFKKYFWLILGLVLFIQPIFLTIIGILLLIYSKDLSSEKKETSSKSEGG